MSIEQQNAPWGESSFEQGRNWYAHLPTNSINGDEKKNYQHFSAMALEDPTFDLFSEFMPTGRPKYDIGRYVMKHAVRVPIIRSMKQWQECLMTGTALLRSEHRQDYAGLSGLLQSSLIGITDSLPGTVEHPEGYNFEWNDDTYGWEPVRVAEGPIRRELDLGHLEMLTNSKFNDQRLGSIAINASIKETLSKGLLDGTVNPSAIMRLKHWENDWERLQQNANNKRYRLRSVDLDGASASRWQFVSGVPVRVLRDPVVEGKYFIGGREAHHHWQVTDGGNAVNIEAHTKTGYRGTLSDKTFEYKLPTQQIIDLYEKVRTLPYFDQRQAPMMEMLYADDGKLHFLQYLKTNLLINDPGEFKLPSGENIVTIHDVRGATTPEGEKLRIYLDPRLFTRSMRGQGFFTDFNMSLDGYSEQVASVLSRVMILDYFLSFKDNHFSSAPLCRAPVAIGLYDGVGEAISRFNKVSAQQPHRDAYSTNTEVEYINAIVTSNGRQATIDSDWQLVSEKIN